MKGGHVTSKYFMTQRKQEKRKESKESETRPLFIPKENQKLSLKRENGKKTAQALLTKKNQKDNTNEIVHSKSNQTN